MTIITQWIARRKSRVLLMAFILIILPPLGLVVSTGSGMEGIALLLIGLVVLGNILALFIP